ncbi:MAG: PASTA domain-containing protein, partial [Alphaproteobacteria bacterium]|nr:PASTA domain-containing protein [Alphaproteobacteria bacterium]
MQVSQPIRQILGTARACGTWLAALLLALLCSATNVQADKVVLHAEGKQFASGARIEALQYAVNWPNALKQVGLNPTIKVELRVNGKRYRTAYDPSRAKEKLRLGQWPYKLSVPLAHEQQFRKLATWVASDLKQIGLATTLRPQPNKPASGTQGDAQWQAVLDGILRKLLASNQQQAALSLDVELVRADPTPRVIGEYIERARDDHRSAGIVIVEVGTVSSKYPPGFIAEQKPRYKEPLPKNRTIEVKTSRRTPTQFVPNVLDLTVTEAQEVLDDKELTHLKIEVVGRAPSTKPVGTIIRQDPPPEIQILKPTPLQVVLSAGPAQPVPTLGKLTGLSVDRAAALVQGLQRTMQVTDSVHHDSRAGTVIAQYPEPGTPIAKFEEVRVVQSLGPAPAPDKRRLPDLRGMAHGEALEAVRLLDREMRVVRRVYDTAPKGTVVQQDPPPGTPVVKVERVEVTESRGPEPTLPDLVGLTLSEAKDLLGRDAPPLRQTGERYATTLVGRIIEQAPPAGTAISQVAAVKVTLSLGPEPTLPDLTKRPFGEAADLLAALDLAHQIDGRDHAEAAADMVIHQEPQAGTPISQVEVVRLRLSLGPEPVLPNLTGLSFTAAEDKLTPLDLALSVGGEDHSRLGRGLVLRQQPDAGTPAGGIDQVQVWLSLGPEPTVPDLTGMTVPDAELRYASLLQAIVVSETRWSLRTTHLIVSQKPLAGTPMPESRTIAVVIAAPPVSGPVLPWLAGGAVALITALSLAVRKWTRTPPEA